MAATTAAASAGMSAFFAARRHFVGYFYYLAGFGVKFIRTAIICIHKIIIAICTF